MPLSAPSADDGARLDSLGRARVALGAIFLLRTTPLLGALHIPFLFDSAPLLGWPDGRFHFAPLVGPLPDLVIRTLCIVRTVAAVAFMLGVAARPAGLVAGSLGLLTVTQVPGRLNTTEQVLFLGTMLLALTDAVNRCALRPGAIRSARSSVWLMRSWIASIYLWAGLAKLRADWLDGSALALFRDEGRFAPWIADLLLSTPARRLLVGSAVAGSELALAALLTIPRTRRAGLFAALALHAGFEAAASPDLFGWVMAALLLCFWDPSRARR